MHKRQVNRNLCININHQMLMSKPDSFIIFLIDNNWVKSFILLLIVFLSACNNKDNQKTLLNNAGIIVGFGDSLTQGVGASVGADYPSVLSDLLGAEVINAGVSGETSDEGLRRIEHVLSKYTPDLVILLHGGNDILRYLPQQNLADNLAKIITKIHRSGAKIILIGVPNFGVILNDAPLYKTLAKRYDLVYIEGVLSDLLSQPAYKSDTIHLNNKGYKALAKAIKQQIEIL